jgi:hypothetical protein
MTICGKTTTSRSGNSGRSNGVAGNGEWPDMEKSSWLPDKYGPENLKFKRTTIIKVAAIEKFD